MVSVALLCLELAAERRSRPGVCYVYMGSARLTEADVAFLPSLPKLAFVRIRLDNEDASAVEATLKRCPKLKKAHV